ncbi:hypothetical protein LLG90_18715 [Aromatoleum toluclasticum]|uniref:hypothetical protein n=1 Tax=Aromatoleum toluclasticum TaxID=92003 RepID=UPI000A07ACAC|nr:hypothetical protein [Aromatoleum toluclasticum]MCC4117391.1 hypothetical protein [Aromatoleum toluclasticum]
MTFLDSPIGRCEAVREMVLLDETQKECAREHGCPDGRNCPLKGWFTEQSGVSDPANLPAKRATPRRRSAAAAKPTPVKARARRSKPLVFAEKAPLPERKVA